MVEFTCSYCGKVNRVAKMWPGQKFCNRSCAMHYNNAKRYGINGNRSVKKVTECKYQPESINCYGDDCAKCGWNPAVARARLDAFMGVTEVANEPKTENAS